MIQGPSASAFSTPSLSQSPYQAGSVSQFMRTQLAVRSKKAGNQIPQTPTATDPSDPIGNLLRSATSILFGGQDSAGR